MPFKLISVSKSGPEKDYARRLPDSCIVYVELLSTLTGTIMKNNYNYSILCPVHRLHVM